MADAAGVINTSGRHNDAEFRRTLTESTAHVHELAFAVRDLVFDVYPETVEVVWPRQRSTGWGIGPRKFTEQFAYLSPHKAHITLGFYHGGELPDPAGLLPESGGKQVSGTLSMRSLRITDPTDLGPAVHALVDAAVKHQTAHIADMTGSPDPGA